MPRSSRHKSSKRSSREPREYSDSEKDSGLKERKGREDGRHLKESGEKRKLDSTKSVDVAKELLVGPLAKVEYIDEYGPSSSSVKKRKEKVDDDRWTGGDNHNNEHELSKSEMMKEVKNSSDSKRSSRRDEIIVSVVDGDEGKRSGSKVESKHHRSDRKERGEKEVGSERERKSSKSEKLADVAVVIDHTGNDGIKKQSSAGEERAGGKHAVGNTGKVT